jgi:hypothetical protein
MSQFKIGDRVYHNRRRDPIARTGFGCVMEIEGTRAVLLWEDDNTQGGVESRDLISEDDAEREGLV